MSSSRREKCLWTRENKGLNTCSWHQNLVSIRNRKGLMIEETEIKPFLFGDDHLRIHADFIGSWSAVTVANAMSALTHDVGHNLGE